MLSSLTRARALLEEGGWLHLAHRAFQKALSPLVEFGTVHFFVRDLRASLRDPPDRTGCSARLAGEEALPVLLQGCHPSRTVEEVQERFRRGQLCFVGEDSAGTIVQTCWVAVERVRIPELDLDVLPGPGEAYLYDGFTPPDLRGKGLYRVLRRVLFSHLATAGYARAHFYIRGDNPVGVRGAAHQQRWLGRLVYVRLRGGRTRIFGPRGGDLPRLLEAGGETLPAEESQPSAAPLPGPHS